MYRFRFSNINELIDGRTIFYLAKDLKMNRDRLSKVLKGTEKCSFIYADKLVKRCKPKQDVSDFFEKLSESEVE